MSHPIRITESDILRAKRLRDEGASWNMIAKAIQHDAASIRCALDPAFRRKRIEMHAANAERLRAERHELGTGSRGQVWNRTPIQAAIWHRHLPELIKERDEREAVPPTLDNVLTGTPIKGRSALDHWQQRGVTEIPRNGRPPNDARPKPWAPLLKGQAQEAAE